MTGRLVFVLLVVFSLAATAEEVYPNRPIRLLVPNAPGGPTDVFARLIAQEATPILGHPVIVETRDGAAGQLAMRAVLAAKPDGYTLIMANVGSVAINPSLHRNAGYRSDTDFVGISMVTRIPLILVVRSDLGVRNIDELLRLMRGNPKAVTFTSPGVGQSTHIAAALFRSIAGTDTVIVPTRGNSQSTNEILAGRVHAMFDSFTSLPHVKSGVLRVLGVAGKDRSPILPDVPTFQESNMPGLDIISWYMLLARSGTPRPIVDKLNAVVVQILRRADVRQHMASWNCEPAPSTSDEAQQYVRSEMAYWGDVIRRAGLEVTD